MQIKLITVALASILSSGVAYADYDVSDLQKLFTDKKQRVQIDAMRSGDYLPGSQKTNQVKVSGYMKRSNGRSVVWMNNKNTMDSSNVDGIQIHRSSVGNNKKVTLSVDGKTVRLKPGDTWSRETGNDIDGASE